MYAMSYNTAPQRREKTFTDLEPKQAQKDPPPLKSAAPWEESQAGLVGSEGQRRRPPAESPAGSRDGGRPGKGSPCWLAVQLQ